MCTKLQPCSEMTCRDAELCSRLYMVIKPEKDTQKEWFEAEIDGMTVARINVLRGEDNIVIKFITVRTEYERTGVARYLVDMLKKWYSTIIAQGVKYNARGFWQKCGFQRIEGTKNYLWTRETSENYPPLL